MKITESLPRSDEQMVLTVIETEKSAMTRSDSLQYFAILTEDAVFMPRRHQSTNSWKLLP